MFAFAGCYDVEVQNSTGVICPSCHSDAIEELHGPEVVFMCGTAVPGQMVYGEHFRDCSWRLSIPPAATTLHLQGCIHNYEQLSYPHVKALELGVFPSPDCQLANSGERAQIREMIRRLRSFPNLQYLTISCCNSDVVPLQVVPLGELPDFKHLSRLFVGGQGCVIAGLGSFLDRAKALKVLSIRGDESWQAEVDDDLKGVCLVPSLVGAEGMLIEELDLSGCVLVEQDSLRHVSNLKKLTPPIFYCIKDIPTSVEELDTTQSEVPSDGYGRLAALSGLRKIIVYKRDEDEVRHALKGLSVEVEVVDDGHIGRGR